MEHEFKQVAALIGDPTRATILWTLLDGRAFTATELAVAADTSAQNISMHLSRLLQAGLLRAESQGRHRYYKFARKEIAYAIEAMAHLVSAPATTGKTAQAAMPAINYCRSCYDHLAGKAGVAITDALLKQKIMLEKNGKFEITAKGEKWFHALQIDTAILKKQRRSFLRPCLDWSERRYHMGGSLAASLLDIMLAQDWIRRIKNSRAVIITATGQKKIHEYFKINL